MCTRVTLAAFCGHTQHGSADASAPRKGRPSLSPSAQGQPLQPGQVAGSSELTFSGFQARCVAHGPPCPLTGLMAMEQTPAGHRLVSGGCIS